MRISFAALANALLSKGVVSQERIEAHSHDKDGKDVPPAIALVHALTEKGVVSHDELDAHDDRNESDFDALHNALFAKGIVTPAEVAAHEPERDEATEPATASGTFDRIRGLLGKGANA